MHKTLFGRVCDHLQTNGITCDIVKYVLDDGYRSSVKNNMTKIVKDGTNGLVDSARYLIHDYNTENRNILHELLKAF